MKIALSTDIHYGVRNDNLIFTDNHKKFLDDVFFPTLKEHQIEIVVCLGDLLDRRKYINYYTAHRLRTDFIFPLMMQGKHFHWILGNHDIYWRNTTDVNAAEELLGAYPDFMRGQDAGSFNIHKDPFEMVFGDWDNHRSAPKMLFLPWICDTNRKQTYELINKTDAKIVFGHLELEGFEMYKGIVQHHGISRDIFKKFDMVCSGHYHHRSTDGRIFYLGACGEYTWADYNDSRGFHLFDCDTSLLTFYPNPYSLFVKVFYDDAKDETNETDFSQLHGKIVKVIVKSRTNSDMYNTFMARCEAAQPSELMVVEDHLNLDMINDEHIVSETKDTLTIIREFISQTNNMVDSTKLDDLIVDLYQEANSLN